MCMCSQISDIFVNIALTSNRIISDRYYLSVMKFEQIYPHVHVCALPDPHGFKCFFLSEHKSEAYWPNVHKYQV